MVPNELEKRLEEEEIRGMIKNINITTLLNSEYCEESWRVKETFYVSDFRE